MQKNIHLLTSCSRGEEVPSCASFCASYGEGEEAEVVGEMVGAEGERVGVAAGVGEKERVEGRGEGLGGEEERELLWREG